MKVHLSRWPKYFTTGGNMKKIVFILALLGPFFIGCAKNMGTDENLQYTDISEIIKKGNVNFDTVNTYVIEPHCIRCHEEWTSESSIREYIVAGNPEKSEFYEEIDEGGMPEGAPELNTQLKDLVYEYILNL